MGELDPHSPLFANTWVDVSAVNATLTTAQSLLAHEYFVTHMELKAQLGTITEYTPLEAMRKALRYALTKHAEPV